MQDYEQDWPGLEIAHLVYYSKKYIVFIDNDFDVDWVTSPEHDEQGPDDPQMHNKLLNIAAKTECIPSNHQERNILLNFKRMIGEAIVCILDRDYKNAEYMLNAAECFIVERNMEQSRFWYLTASGATALFIGTLGLVLWYFRTVTILLIGGTAFFLILSCTAGALGSLLSVIMRLGKSTMNPAAGKNLHYLEGFFKIIAGCISALLIALSVYLGLLVPIFSRIEHTFTAMIFAGLIAGASERWAPSLISNIEKMPADLKKKEV